MGSVSSPHVLARFNKHFRLPAIIQSKEIKIDVPALMDSGSQVNTIHPSLVKIHKLPIIPHPLPYPIQTINRSPVQDDLVRYQCKVSMNIGKHNEEIILDIVNTGRHGIVLGLPWLRLHNPNINWEENTLVFNKKCLNHLHNKSQIDEIITINTVELQDEAELKKTILKEYWDYLSVFSSDAASCLPSHSSHDCAINLKDKEKLPIPGKIYPMSESELKELREYLIDMEKKGFIRQSKSQVTAPCFYVKKKDTTRRLVIDYHSLNEETKPNQYPLPLTNKITERL